MENPDVDIENFWLTFKCCIVNFYKFCKKEINIDEMSNQFNKLQQKRDYREIELRINSFIIDLIGVLFDNISKIYNSQYIYYSRIIITNLKRWMNIREKKLFVKEDIELENKKFLMVRLYSNLLKNIEKGKYIDDIIIFFQLTNDNTLYTDHKFMIDFALEVKNSSMLETLDKVTNVREYINEQYGRNFFNNMSFNKIIKKLDVIID
tara:strand:+ start:4076 stop:4696 length:621 start_codon:yes stop_codon:yes gene_type:complete